MRRPDASSAFLVLCLVLAGSTLAARGAVALGTSDVLNWDETYYASTTSTAAHGLGLYPYVLGYPPMPLMGGVGYAAEIHVLSYRLLGPHLISLRVAAFLASLAAVAGLVVLTRRLYGTAAGLATLALTPWLAVFQMSNTIRFDVFAIAWVAWALVLYVVSAESTSVRRHGLVGLVFAIGLQVHLHTAAAAFAVGTAYLVPAIGRRMPKPLLGYVGGYLLGAVLFIAVNVAPSPQTYFRTAALARLSAADPTRDLNLTARMDQSALAKSFVSPAQMVRKEAVRYRSLFRAFRWWELLLWLGGVPALLWLRPVPAGVDWRVLVAGAVTGGAIVFNSAAVEYFSAILPFFVPALASFVTHGFGRAVTVDRREAGWGSCVAMLALAAAILPGVLAPSGPLLSRLPPPPPPAPPPVVQAVTHAVSTGCVLAGPADLYAKYFMAFPRFLGTRKAELLIGSTYFDLQGDPVGYWRLKRPDVVIGPVDDDLARYLREAGYAAVAENVWKSPGPLTPGCVISGLAPSGP